MRTTTILAVVLLAVSFGFAGRQESVTDLKARMETASPSDQVKLSMRIAELQFDGANAAYGQDNRDQGAAAVQEMLAYCEKAASLAVSSGKRLKQTEIQIRDLERKLQNLIRSREYEDREALQPGIERLEKVRSDLLATMFRKK